MRVFVPQKSAEIENQFVQRVLKSAIIMMSSFQQPLFRARAITQYSFFCVFGAYV